MGAPGGEATAGALLERELVLPPRGTSTGAARRFVAAWLRELGLDHLEDAAVLAVSELVTNAVLHARSEIDVAVRADAERVRIQVGDLNDSAPTLRDYGTHATTGRGLALVRAVTDELGVQHREVGKTVWFTLSRSAVPPQEGPELPGGFGAFDLEALGLDGLALDELDEPGSDEPDAAPPPPAQALLLDLPVTLWLAAHQHHDAALRELVLFRGERTPDTTEAWAWYAAADAGHAALARAVQQAVHAALLADVARAALPPGHPGPVPDVPAVLTVPVPLSEGLPAQLAALVQALADADALAASGQLLAYPALPEVVALRTWCRDEVTRQAAGLAPSAWSGDVDDDGDGRGPVVGWGEEALRTTTEAVVAADDRNRVLGLSPAAERLLGWSSEELAGRRVVVIVPEHLRDAHTAGFTRHQVTGQAHALGVSFALPVLRADGTEVLCRFLIQQARAEDGRAVYEARLEPVEPR